MRASRAQLSGELEVAIEEDSLAGKLVDASAPRAERLVDDSVESMMGGYEFAAHC